MCRCGRRPLRGIAPTTTNLDGHLRGSVGLVALYRVTREWLPSTDGAQISDEATARAAPIMRVGATVSGATCVSDPVGLRSQPTWECRHQFPDVVPGGVPYGVAVEGPDIGTVAVAEQAPIQVTAVGEASNGMQHRIIHTPSVTRRVTLGAGEVWIEVDRQGRICA